MTRRRRRGEILGFLREAVWERRYVYTRHAKLEMAEDRLRPRDVRGVLLSGELVRTLTGDPRGPRHVQRGKAADGRPVEVVWRRVLDYVRVITVYVLD
jgi:hypothetical protein